MAARLPSLLRKLRVGEEPQLSRSQAWHDCAELCLTPPRPPTHPELKPRQPTVLCSSLLAAQLPPGAEHSRTCPMGKAPPEAPCRKGSSNATMVDLRTLYWPPASLLCWDPRQVDVALHGWERLDLAPGPATLAMPQACVRALAQPAVPACLPNHPLVVVDVGHTAHRGHAGLQHLGDREKRQASLGTHSCMLGRPGQGQRRSSTCICLLEGSCTMAVPFTFLSSTPQVPAAGKRRGGSCPAQQDKVSHPAASATPCWELLKAPAVALCAALLPGDRTPRHHQETTGQSCPRLSGGLSCTLTRGEGRTATPCHWPPRGVPPALLSIRAKPNPATNGGSPAQRRTSCPDVLRSLPRVALQVADQRANRQSPQRVGVPFVG